jgi:type VI secretion system protein ImpK
MLDEGLCLLHLIQEGSRIPDSPAFQGRVDQWLSRFERTAVAAGKPSHLVLEAKYAFCALMDERILSSDSPLREAWERSPLQLRHFGEHLAGEGFFHRLERLRQTPAASREALEVFHTCLLLGFQGRYLLEGGEKLRYLTRCLGQELASGEGALAPRWRPPRPRARQGGGELPLWAFFAVIGAAALTVFLTFTFLLRSQAAVLQAPARASLSSSPS